MNDPMDYSVVIPAYDAEATLAEAIGSLQQQSLPPAAIIVVDDGSHDRTAEVALSLGPLVQLIRQANAGPGAATTHGMAAVRTPFVGMLDADDLWLPDKARQQLQTLQATAGLDAVFGQMRLFADDPADSRIGEVVPGWGRSTLMMRTGLFARTGPVIDPPGLRGDMVDWIARARAVGGQLVHLEGVVALRRIRPGSLSNGRDPARDRGYLLAARAALLRRRAARGEGR